MKKIKILTVVLLAIGLASAGIGCGSSSSGSGGGGGTPSGSLQSLPNASLTVSNVGGAASQAIGSANVPPPSNVSSITGSTVSKAGNQTMPLFSYMFKGMDNNVVIKPQSMKGTALNALSAFKQAVASGSCAATSYTGTAAGGNISVTVVWDNAKCSSSGSTLTINGTVTVIGTYDTSLGNLDITYAENVTFGWSDTNGYTATITMKGRNTITAAGIVAGTTSVSYNDKGTIYLGGSATGPNGSGSFSGYITVDDTFTGKPSQLTYSINDGTEYDVNGSKVLGTYGIATITLTTSGSPVTSVTVNGGGTFGVAVSGSTYGYSGKISVSYAGVVFDPSVCFGYPSSGTITITAANVWVLDFNVGCGKASVTEDGVSKGPISLP